MTLLTGCKMPYGIIFVEFLLNPYGVMMPSQSQQRSLIFPILMVIAGLALIVGSIWMTINARAAQNMARAGQGAGTAAMSSNSPVAGTPPRIPFPDVPRVGVGDAKAALDLQQAIFIDTRGEPFYAAGHLPGALSITKEELPQRMGELDKNTWIIPYCT